jgi:hypothetical protein
LNMRLAGTLVGFTWLSFAQLLNSSEEEMRKQNADIYFDFFIKFSSFRVINSG